MHVWTGFVVEIEMYGIAVCDLPGSILMSHGQLRSNGSYLQLLLGSSGKRLVYYRQPLKSLQGIET